MSTTDERLAAIVSSFEEALFERLDKQHNKGIHDDEVIRFLRAEGHYLLATRYIEWAGALDPDREDDNTTMNPAVPDPGDSPTNQLIHEAHQIGVVKALITEQLKVERQKDLYFNEQYDRDEAMLDGPVNLTDLARAVVKGLGK